MALTLQLLMLVIATLGFAVPSTALLLNAAAVYVAVGTQNYVCSTDSGTFVASTFDAQLYDASSVDSTDDFNTDISDIINYEKANSSVNFSEVGAYIQANFGFKPAGQAKDVGGATVEMQILDENTGQSDTLDVTVVPASQSVQGVTLTNEEGTATFIVTNSNPPPTAPCSPGSDGFKLSVVESVYLYGRVQ